jgi:hypothetical protein
MAGKGDPVWARRWPDQVDAHQRPGRQTPGVVLQNDGHPAPIVLLPCAAWPPCGCSPARCRRTVSSHTRRVRPMATHATPIPRQAWSVLIVSTVAFTVCFMVWMMFGVIGIPLKKTLGLSATEFGLLTATPVLTGSLIRVPLGIWTDRYGGRIVMTLLMAATVPAIWLMAYATAYWHFLVIGLFVGLAGGSFSVGTPYVARWFPKSPPGHGDGRVRRGQLRLGGQQVRRAGAAGHRRLDAGAAGVCRHDAGHRHPVLVRQQQRPQAPGAVEREVQRPAQAAEGPEGAEVLPVLQHRVRRLRGAGAVDGAVLRGRVRPVDPDGRVAGRLLQPARRRAARRRRRAVRQVRRAPGHLVGAVGQLGVPVPAELSADRLHGAHRQRPAQLPHRPERLCLHRADVHPGHRLGLRQGQRLQVHRQRLPRQHRRRQRHRRPGRRPGRLCAADHVRRA